MAGLKRWWVSRYNLPPNHPLFVGQSVAELNLEWFEDLMLRRVALQEMIDEGNCDYSATSKELDEINQALGEQAVESDDLIDKWERQIANGEMPDLDEGLNRG
jgi:hypothetical protein